MQYTVAVIYNSIKEWEDFVSNRHSAIKFRYKPNHLILEIQNDGADFTYIGCRSNYQDCWSRFTGANLTGVTFLGEMHSAQVINFLHSRIRRWN